MQPLLDEAVVQLRVAVPLGAVQVRVATAHADLVGPGVERLQVACERGGGGAVQERDVQAGRIGTRAKERIARHDAGQLVARSEQDLHVEAQLARDAFLDATNDCGGALRPALEHDIAALDVRDDVGVAEPYEQGLEHRHLDPVAPTDVDAAQHRNIGGHRLLRGALEVHVFVTQVREP